MSVTFGVRGSSLTPIYATVANTTYSFYKNNAAASDPAVVADAGAGIIGGSVLDLNDTVRQRGIYYRGFENISQNAGFSVLVRKVSRYSGTPANHRGIIEFDRLNNTGVFGLAHLNNGTLYARYANRYNTLIANNAGGVFAPVANVVNDHFFTWDGTTNANSAKYYVDATLNFQFTPTGVSDHVAAPFTDILLGPAVFLTAFGDSDFNEVVLWDQGGMDPTNIMLVSGLGSLNGASRTSFVALPSASGGGTYPSESLVINGTVYGPNDTDYTGDFVSPSEDDVAYGVQYGSGGTQYTGSRFVPGAIVGNGNWAPQEVQKEIWLLLIADDEIIDLLGGDSNSDVTSDKVFDFIPDDEDMPFISLQILPWSDRSSHTHDGFECEFQINVWYSPEGSNTGLGNKVVQGIQQRIDELLHNTNLCVDGWNSLLLRRTYVDIETQEDNVTKHGIQRFKLLLGSKT